MGLDIETQMERCLSPVVDCQYVNDSGTFGLSENTNKSQRLSGCLRAAGLDGSHHSALPAVCLVGSDFMWCLVIRLEVFCVFLLFTSRVTVLGVAVPGSYDNSSPTSV